jgi:hypothetical protein
MIESSPAWAPDMWLANHKLIRSMILRHVQANAHARTVISVAYHH